MFGRFYVKLDVLRFRISRVALPDPRSVDSNKGNALQEILLIDDHPQVIKDVLTLYGYRVTVAEDGYQGVQTLLDVTRHFDMVILDVDMPRMDGWEVLKLIRNGRECPDIPVIMLTCHGDEDNVVRGLRREADEYLVKPISPKRFLAHVEAVLRRAEKQSLPEDPEITRLRQSVQLLTMRETEILRYLVQGLSNQQIAEALVISETTVKNHLAHIFKKLNVSNRTQAAYFAQKLQLF